MRRFVELGMMLCAMVAAGSYFNSDHDSAEAKDQSEFIRYSLRYNPSLLVLAEPEESKDKLPPVPNTPLKDSPEVEEETVEEAKVEEVVTETKPATKTYTVRRQGFLSRLFRR